MKVRLILAFLIGIFGQATLLQAADGAEGFVESQLGGKHFIWAHPDNSLLQQNILVRHRLQPETKEISPEIKEIPFVRIEPLSADKQVAANEALWLALKRWNPQEVEKALWRRACVDAKNEDGLTPLMYASEHRLWCIAKIFIERGADINAVTEDAFKKTAWMFALESGCEEIVHMLRNRINGPDPEDPCSLLNRPELLAVANALTESGYFISPQMPLSPSVESGLKELFSDPQHKNSTSFKEAHKDSTHSFWGMEADFLAKKNIYSIHPTGSTMLLPRTIEALAQEILTYLGDGRYYLQINLFDDFGMWVKENEKELRSLDPAAKSSMRSLGIPPLTWHQDKFGPDASNYDHLFFRVLETSGIINNYNKLELGTALASDISNPPDFAPEAVDDRVKVIGAVEGISGAGYFIDQNFVTRDGGFVLHRHTGQKISISNCNLSDVPLDYSFFDGCRKPSGNDHNCLSPEYKRPTRKTLVVRIKRLDPKNDASQSMASAQAD